MDIAVADAGNAARRDPTRTTSLRKAFRSAALLRLAQVQVMLRQAVVDHDMLGLDRNKIPYSPEQLKVFSAWFEHQAKLQLANGWVNNWIARANASGVRRARKEIKLVGMFTRSRVSQLETLADAELRGIASALAQQVIRCASVAVDKSVQPTVALQMLIKPFDGIKHRLKAFANTMTVKGHVNAKLDTYRMNGIAKVGVIPETVKPKARITKAAKATRDAAYQYGGGSGDEDEDLVSAITAGDDDVCDVCLDYADDGPYNIEDIEIPLHPNAVLAGSTFAAYGATREMVRAQFSGMAVTVRTTNNAITIGPNHPMLTRRGFVKARDLTKGDQLVYDTRLDVRSHSGGPADFQKVPLVENAFETLAVGHGGLHRLTASRDDLHGDAVFCQPEVDVIYPTRDLLPVFDPCGIQQFSELNFPRTNMALAIEACLRSGNALFSRGLSAKHRCMRMHDLAPALSGAHSRPFDPLLLGASATSRIGFIQNTADDSAADSKSACQSIDTMSCFVKTSDCFRWHDVIEVSLCHFDGLAFDATTTSGIYNSDGYVVKNCRCSVTPYYDQRYAQDAAPLTDAWTEEAREAALEARRAAAHHREKAAHNMKKAAQYRGTNKNKETKFTTRAGFHASAAAAFENAAAAFKRGDPNAAQTMLRAAKENSRAARDAYNPDQDRDYHGRFGSGGGPSAAARTGNTIEGAAIEVAVHSEMKSLVSKGINQAAISKTVTKWAAKHMVGVVKEEVHTHFHHALSAGIVYGVTELGAHLGEYSEVAVTAVGTYVVSKIIERAIDKVREETGIKSFADARELLANGARAVLDVSQDVNRLRAATGTSRSFDAVSAVDLLRLFVTALEQPTHDANPPTSSRLQVIRDKIRSAENAAQAIQPTSTINSTKRQELRRTITTTLYEKNLDDRQRDRDATIITGLPASGKSTLAKPIVAAKGAVEIDPNNAKAMLPEYQNGIGAAAVHAESSDITAAILKQALANGDNIVWPCIGNPASMTDNVQNLQQQGYSVNIKHLNVPMHDAMRSAVQRFVTTDHYEPLSIIRDFAHASRNAYENGKSVADTHELYVRASGNAMKRVDDRRDLDDDDIDDLMSEYDGRASPGYADEIEHGEDNLSDTIADSADTYDSDNERDDYDGDDGDDAMYDAFNPDQPRAPAGSPGGGQFGSGGSNGSGSGSEQRQTGGPGGRGSGKRSVAQAQRAAKATAGSYSPLKGLPVKAIELKPGRYYVPGPIARLKDAAAAYTKSSGIDYHPPTEYAKLDKDRAAKIADAFDKMPHAPNDPHVKAAYDALSKETMAQWDAIKKTGLKVEWIKPGQVDPYEVSPRLAAMDVADNNHWWGFPTDRGFGSGEEAKAAAEDNPLLKPTGEIVDGRPTVVNDIFRIVHDAFGHFKEGNGFRAEGEENAWRSHSAMYSPLAREALTSETRGQNSWVNFGPHGDTNRTANTGDTYYAPQKVGVLPQWAVDDGSGRVGTKDYNPDQPRVPAGGPGGGQFGSGGGTGATEAFVSPNLGHLNFGQAQANISGERQQALLKTSDFIDAGLGLKTTKATSAIGAWTDGAENSVLMAPSSEDYSLVKAAVAMKAHLAGQKDALVFKQDDDGPDFMMTMDTTKPQNLSILHQRLMNYGIPDHTIEPLANGNVRIHVFGSTQALADKVVDFAANQPVNNEKVTYGHGEFIGTNLGDEHGDAAQRADARQQYDKIITQAQATSNFPGTIARVWKDAGNYWHAQPGTAEQAEVAASLHPAVVNVGGDEWNKQTAVRLELQYQKAKPALEAVANKVVGTSASDPTDEDDEDQHLPEDWSTVSSDEAEATENEWKEANKSDYEQHEIDNWHENGEALDDAKSELSYVLNNKDFINIGTADKDWFTDATAEVNAAREEAGEPEIPYTDAQLWNAISIEHESGYGGDDEHTTLDFDDSQLKEPSNAPPKEQLSLPGITPPDLSSHLTADMRDQLQKAVLKGFNEKASELEGDKAPPDYLYENASESMSNVWSEMSDDDKFSWGIDHGIIDAGDTNASPKQPVTIPSTFDPLDTTEGGSAYKATGRFGKAVSVERAAELMVARGAVSDLASARDAANEMDSELWSGWKSTSTGTMGNIMQAAVAAELGGRLKSYKGVSMEEGKKLGDQTFNHRGGFEAVKAYVRAKWETTQYMLDKAGDHSVDLYRGIEKPHDAVDEAKVGEFTKLPNEKLERSGASSMTTDPKVANNWDGGNRIVLRAQVPRTAIISVPAYGDNIYKEHEVVVAGTAWKKWDAWADKAPTFEDTPLADRLMKLFGDSIVMYDNADDDPHVIDLYKIDIDAGKNWLMLDRADKRDARIDAIAQKVRAANEVKRQAQKQVTSKK